MPPGGAPHLSGRARYRIERIRERVVRRRVDRHDRLRLRRGIHPWQAEDGLFPADPAGAVAVEPRLRLFLDPRPVEENLGDCRHRVPRVRRFGDDGTGQRVARHWSGLGRCRGRPAAPSTRCRRGVGLAGRSASSTLRRRIGRCRHEQAGQGKR